MTEPEESMTIKSMITTDEGEKEAGTIETPRKEVDKNIPVMPSWFKALGSDTGKGELSEYMNHPLNYDGDKSTGRIIRGVTGIIGNTNKGVVDIFVGMMEKIAKMFERKAEQ